MSGDPIEEYLGRLRSQLRAPVERTAQILAEAEDHLRESVAAGVAIGMTEREAQEAAISAFGSVRAVVRAHRRPASAVVTDVGMALWKLAAAYLLTVPVAGAAQLIIFYRALQVRTVAPGPVPGTLVFTSGIPDVVGFAVGLTGSALAGLALLLGYRRVRRSLRRRGQSPLAPFGGFPLAAAIFMLVAGPTAGWLIAHHVHLSRGFAMLGGAGAAGSVLVCVGWVAAMAITLARQGRDTGSTEEEVPCAG